MFGKFHTADTFQTACATLRSTFVFYTLSKLDNAQALFCSMPVYFANLGLCLYDA